MTPIDSRVTLITGGTGSLGKALVRHLLSVPSGPESIRVLSRDEVKQAGMRAEFNDDARLRFFLGDVRDQDRVSVAARGADFVVHAAALKRVDACAYSPMEAIQTNVMGTWNVLRASIASGSVKKVIAISSDKACAPLNLYGKTKAVMEDLVANANSYAGDRGPRFSCVRYGNVAGSRGSVIPLWKEAIAAEKPVRIMGDGATRFWFTLRQAVALVLHAAETMAGGEVYVPDARAFLVRDLARALWADKIEFAPRRDGDKIHEQMISDDEAYAFRWDDGHFVRHLPGQERGTPLPDGFCLSSDAATRMSVDELREALREVE